ncbi:hypothetical protein [Undibacterium baiyunense]|uniref:Uncharacterized protein n=1 Tax=Undibacterium baiyunense TaxID=2828731 RepID=A0A941I0E5_9BURK|nr:hypothetical protein [Undibacterium baiyunense]MBR7745148.1 hypothetical protein [Undibacterium baiyunense]
MNKHEKIDLAEDLDMRNLLEKLLADDLDISARAVARLHPTLKAASSITRSVSRSKLLADYQKRQAEYRRWRGRVSRRSSKDLASALAEKEIRIRELETSVQLLTASHLAMIRVVGELGGFSKWANFFEFYTAARDNLYKLGALPETSVAPLAQVNKRIRKS